MAATLLRVEQRPNIAMSMTTLTAYVEHDPETRLYVGTVLGVPGAHSQGATLDELNANLRHYGANAP